MRGTVKDRTKTSRILVNVRNWRNTDIIFRWSCPTIRHRRKNLATLLLYFTINDCNFFGAGIRCRAKRKRPRIRDGFDTSCTTYSPQQETPVNPENKNLLGLALYSDMHSDKLKRLKVPAVYLTGDPETSASQKRASPYCVM